MVKEMSSSHVCLSTVRTYNETPVGTRGGVIAPKWQSHGRQCSKGPLACARYITNQRQMRKRWVDSPANSKGPLFRSGQLGDCPISHRQLWVGGVVRLRNWMEDQEAASSCSPNRQGLQLWFHVRLSWLRIKRATCTTLSPTVIVNPDCAANITRYSSWHTTRSCMQLVCDSHDAYFHLD